MKQRQSGFDWGEYFSTVSGSRPRVLLLDYDGTLAPFRVARDQAVLPPDVRAALQGIIGAGRTRLIVISGRALRDLVPLLALDPLPELWGSHGWERRLPDGRSLGPELEPGVAQALQDARQWTRSAGLDGACEVKPAGVAVHWRGLKEPVIERLRARVRAAWEPLARDPRLELHEFDGGLELRAAGRDKGHVVTQILNELADDAIVAFAGDDVTDEDAFRALSGRGLSILVRPEYRETAADMWLQPPHEWLRFLQAWLAADREGGQE